MNTSVVSSFNNYFEEFVKSIRCVFPYMEDLEIAEKAIQTIRKINPKLVLKSFKKYFLEPYANQIENGDITFFIKNDYSYIVGDNRSILDKIDILRVSVGQMSPNDQEKVVLYIQNLIRLLYMEDK